MEKAKIQSFSIYPKHLEKIKAYTEPRLINFSQFVVQAIL
jgi:hypothetical protein